MTRTATSLALSFALALPVTTAHAQAPAAPTTSDATAVSAPRGTPQELNFNFFRNPSIGLEYRLGPVAVHGGAYPTVISKNAAGKNETSWFVRAGVTTFFLPHVWNDQRPSEFYASASYLRGLNLGRGNAALLETGYRWMVWRGLNLRIGVAVLLERGRDVKVNPTPGIGWSQAF
jgi:hypothetical protein